MKFCFKLFDLNNDEKICATDIFNLYSEFVGVNPKIVDDINAINKGLGRKRQNYFLELGCKVKKEALDHINSMGEELRSLKLCHRKNNLNLKKQKVTEYGDKEVETIDVAVRQTTDPFENRFVDTIEYQSQAQIDKIKYYSNKSPFSTFDKVDQF